VVSDDTIIVYLIEFSVLNPDKRISGGKVLSAKIWKVKNRVAIVLRLGAKSLSRAKDYFRRVFPQNASQAWHCPGHYSNGA
jgi:hypothetical protein